MTGTQALNFTAPAKPETAAKGKQDFVSIGYLRAFVTLLVLAHHAVLAYHPFAPPAAASLAAQPRWWQAFPVVDRVHSNLFALLVGFNDNFFMSLMFLISGWFVWRSLQRKGSATFLKDRALRLGLPFLLAAALVAPAAYYPSYLQTSGTHAVAGFWREWLALGQWPAGPAWFVWLLLAFDTVAAAAFAGIPRLVESAAARLVSLGKRPARLFWLLCLMSALVYVPMALRFNALSWTAVGPFAFQTSRLLHYFVYFATGVAMGAADLGTGLLSPEGMLRRSWLRWAGYALLAFGTCAVVTVAALSPGHISSGWQVAGALCFVVSCAASSFALIAVFLRFAARRRPLFDSLRENAYGMYLIHYAFVSWLQYALLPAGMPALVKGAIVFLGTVGLSWAGTALIRRLPGTARVI